MTCVILTGGIDLSVGSVLALTTAFCAAFIKGGMPTGIAMLLALVIGTLFGCVSGILVTKGRLQPFIATLITMTAFRGITMIFMNGKPISGLGSSPLLKFVGKGSVLGIPFPVILFVAVFLALTAAAGYAGFLAAQLTADALSAALALILYRTGQGPERKAEISA